MDDATWTALTLTIVLTLGSGALTWLAFRRRGLPAGLLGAAITLLFPAAYLTRTLRMFADIAGSVSSWATSLVLSPTVWLGIALAGVSVVLFGTSRALASRDIGTRRPVDGRGGPAAAPGAPARDELPASRRPASKGAGKGGKGAPQGEPAIDDELADIEAILRKRGIS